MRKLRIGNFEQNWDFLPFFQFLTALSTLFGKFYAQLTPTNLLNSLMNFDFKTDQQFPNYQAQKVKFPQLT